LSFSLAVTLVVAISVFCLSHGFRFYGFVSDLEPLASSLNLNSQKLFFRSQLPAAPASS
jgi:hypothetical protein